MKHFSLLLYLLITSVMVSAQEVQKVRQVPDSSKKIQVVEASCGQCNFGLKGKGCTLAVRINGKAWFVEGTLIDDHGDAHADEGFCNAIRKARIQGQVVNGKFVATWFQLLPKEIKKDN